MINTLQFQRGDVLEANRTDIELGVFKGHRYLVDELFDGSYGIRGIEPKECKGIPSQWFMEQSRSVVEGDLYSRIAHVDIRDRQVRAGGVDDLLQVIPELNDYVSASK